METEDIASSRAVTMLFMANQAELLVSKEAVLTDTNMIKVFPHCLSSDRSLLSRPHQCFGRDRNRSTAVLYMCQPPALNSPLELWAGAAAVINSAAWDRSPLITLYPFPRKAC